MQFFIKNSFKSLYNHSLAKWKNASLLLFFALLPPAFLTYHFFSNMQALSESEDRLRILQAKAKKILPQQLSFQQTLKNADRFYIDKQLETLSFLQKELRSLKARTTHTPAEIERISFLEKENQLLFAEESTQRKDKIEEVMEKQKRPVEIDEEDLKELLMRIEGIPSAPHLPQTGRPQLIIKKFELQKKQNTYLLNLNLIKREEIEK